MMQLDWLVSKCGWHLLMCQHRHVWPGDTTCMFQRSPNAALAQPLPDGERLVGMKGGQGRGNRGRGRGREGGREGGGGQAGGKRKGKRGRQERMREWSQRWWRGRGGGHARKNSRVEKHEVNMLKKTESHPPDEAALHNMVASRFHSQYGPHALQLPQQPLLGLTGSCSVD